MAKTFNRKEKEMEVLRIDHFLDMPNILVADDCQETKGLLWEILEEKGYKVETASNGADALRKIVAGDFNLVISDIEMPVVTGIEMAERMRSLKDPTIASLPLILMSGNAAPYLKEIEVLADYFLPKPFKIEDLLSTVRKALGE